MTTKQMPDKVFIYRESNGCYAIYAESGLSPCADPAPNTTYIREDTAISFTDIQKIIIEQAWNWFGSESDGKGFYEDTIKKIRSKLLPGLDTIKGQTP